MQQGVSMHATCSIQQCWELLANNVQRPFASNNNSPIQDYVHGALWLNFIVG